MVREDFFETYNIHVPYYLLLCFAYSHHLLFLFQPFAGAEQQEFHPDTQLSYSTHPDDFVHEYTLAIPLQDTTKEMGATQICPGTQKCSGLEFDRVERFHAFIKDLYPNIADKEYNVILEDEEFVEWTDYNYPCDPTATLKAGGGLLYDASVLHRGGGYVDDYAEAAERVIIFITFAGSRQGRDDERSLPFGENVLPYSIAIQCPTF